MGRGVVIDVPHCEFSEVVLSRWRGKHLVSVEPADQADDEADRRLAVHGERSSIWRMSSTEAAERIDDQSLDFVYLNATHDYASVKLELERWFDKVRVGGFLAGNSYVDGDLFEGDFGVRSAVNEFFAAQDLRVRTTVLDAAVGLLVRGDRRPALHVEATQPRLLTDSSADKRAGVPSQPEVLAEFNRFVLEDAGCPRAG